MAAVFGSLFAQVGSLPLNLPGSAAVAYPGEATSVGGF